MFCRNCGFKLPDEAKFCLSCGEKTPVQESIKCPACAEPLPFGAKFCRACGSAVSQDTPPVSQPPVFTAPQPQTDFDEDAPTMMLNTSVRPQTAEPVAQNEPVQQSVQPVAQSAPAQHPTEQSAPVRPQSVQPAGNTVTAPELANIKLPSFLGTGGTAVPAPVNNVSTPARTPQKPAKRRRKKSGGVAAVIIIVLLLLAAAAAAVYFILFSDSARIEKLKDQAEICMKADDLDGAIAAYSECIIIGTTDPEIHLALADIHLEEDDRESALEALRKGYEVTADPEIWERLKELEDEIDSEKITD
ncbi:MAG: zinc-ribbon domain-containing protein [Ruminococcaceae bacterium]|nr:zinc-ribbon domain-containing protein [Oscillospiraceae bacterium]